jgi:uncharacterized membrane-anchored protein
VKKASLLLAFVVLALGQLGTPAWMIAEREVIRRRGTEMKFRTAPVDPYDAFRGRYVRLSFDLGMVARQPDWDLPEEGRAERYVALAEDEDGFAKVTGVSEEPPGHARYVRAEVRTIGPARKGEDSPRVRIDWRFERYYMREDLAEAGEEAFRGAREEEEQPAYATVRVYKGGAVLTGLYVGGTPIRELVEERVRAQPVADTDNNGHD